jgi:hypothetical protein
MSQDDEILGKAYDGRLMRRLLGYLRPYRWQALTALAAIISNSALQLAPPYLTKLAIDRHISTGQLEGLGTIAAAYFAVLVTSSGQGRIARADTIAAQLAQLVVEQARSLPYESVGTSGAPSGQPAGVLLSTETTTYQGFSFTVTRQVTWVDDAANNANTVGDVTKDYKQLVVQVAWTGGHTTPLVTFIRDRANDTPTPPDVMWSQSPPPNAVLFTLNGATRVWNRSSDPSGTTSDIASLQASASIDASLGTIVRVEFYSGTRVFMSGTGNSVRVIAPAPLSGTGWPCDSWGTLYTAAYPMNLASLDASDALLFPEGKNTIRVVAYANSMAYGYQLLSVTVDNAAAVFPSGSVVRLVPPSKNSDRYAGSVVAEWEPPLDGTDPTLATADPAVSESTGGDAAPTPSPIITAGSDNPDCVN